MILYIDTSKSETKIALFENKRILAKKVWLSDKNQSEELLSEIDDLIKSIHRNKLDLKGIIVVNGPGSYTGLRVGLSTANALAFSLNILVKDVSSGQNNYSELELKSKNVNHFKRSVMPKYLYEPKITKPKPRR